MRQRGQEDTIPMGQLRTSSKNLAKTPGRILGAEGQQMWKVGWWSHLQQSKGIEDLGVDISSDFTNFFWSFRYHHCGGHKSKVGKLRHQVLVKCRFTSESCCHG